MPELLIELYSEEIPARMQARAADALERALNAALMDAGFMPEAVKAFAGPRRLVVTATGLPARQPDRREEKKGPRVGAPEKAIDGFLKSAGLASIDQCETRTDKKGDYYVAIVDHAGRDTADLIARFTPEIIRGFAWPKSMRWGAGDLKWVRPLHRILCVFDGEPVTFEIDGLVAGDETSGHRFMAPASFQTRSFDDYAAKLRTAKVILDTDERKEIIAADAATLCGAQGLALVEDDGLLNDVAGLAEWPVAMIGGFDEKFLALPDEVLTASMRGHQKYFSVRDPKTDRLANKFVCVANIEAPPNAPKDWGAAMRAGYERVLTARLSDGWYLYNQDRKASLDARIDALDKVTFFEGLGSLGDKARRVAALARDIAPAVGADADVAERAAMLAKADLVTQMVNEFPELQGVMGRYYALDQGEAAEIADAVRDHYKPAGQGEPAPTAPVSVAVALADRLDTLTAFWAIDKKPTGSSDPFALRRAALGVISLILTNGVRRPLPGADSDLLAFFHDRLKVYLRDKGARHDQIDAVLTDAGGAPQDDIVLVVEKLAALEAFLKTEDGANLVAAFKRAANIIKAEDKKGGVPTDLSVDAGALSADDEKALFTALQRAEADAADAVAAENFEAAMSALAALRGPLDAFFDTVTVNADEAALRTNRLALLQRLLSATRQVADFSKLEG